MTSTPPSPSSKAGLTKTLVTTTTRQVPKFALKQVRAANDDMIMTPQFSREYRTQCSTKERLQLSREACKGAELKLQKVNYARISTYEKDDELLKNNVAIETFIRKFKEHCTKFDMTEFLSKFPVLEDNCNDANRFDKGNTINLLENWDRIGDGVDKRITVTEIADTISWIKCFATDDSTSFLEDMEWTHLHIMDSMDEELHEAVGSILDQDYTVGQRGGPLTFAIAMDQCINLSEEAIDDLKTSIETYDIKTVKGEDISLVCRHFKYALKRLHHNGAITPTLTKNLFKVFQTTSVPEFNAFVAHWMRDSMRKSSKRPSYQEILVEVEDFYKRLLASREWLGIKGHDTPSSFHGSKPNVTNDTSRPRAKKNFSRPTDKDKTSSDPDRFSRTMDERTWKWCAKCWNKPTAWNKLTEATQGRWSTTHYSDEHTGGKPKDIDTPAGNVATDATDSKPKKVSFAQSLSDAAATNSN